jgi:serine protease Do
MSKRILRRCCLVAAALLAVAVVAAAGADERRVPNSPAEVQLSFAPVARKALPAVVNIYSQRTVQTRGFSPLFEDPLFRRFFGDQLPHGLARRRLQNSLGSGVIVDADGIIVTNHHLVGGADEIRVVLADRREFDARRLGSDERTDLAVLKIDTGGERLPTLALGDSDKVEVGDLVLAIGNPFGVGQTVTSGIVSALARTRVGITDLNFFIQTDAAINPGNSGGALVDIIGTLIGINTAIYSRSGGSIGIGFAIPSNMVRAVIGAIAGGGRLVRPWLGAWGREMSADIAQSLDLPRPTGVLIEDIYRGGPAAEAGVRVGDVVLAIEGHAVDDPAALDYRLATLAVGGAAELRVWRQGKERSVRITLVEAPDQPPRETAELEGRHPFAGAVVANLSPALAEELQLKRFRPGVVVLALRGNASANRFGLRRGDRLLRINGMPVESVGDLKRSLGRGERRWEVSLDRDGETVNLVIRG